MSNNKVSYEEMKKCKSLLDFELDKPSKNEALIEIKHIITSQKEKL